MTSMRDSDLSKTMLAPSQADQYVNKALDAVGAGDGCRAVLDALPIPVYMTDAEGLVTYWNQACVAFAGREPQLGRDRWCVTWPVHDERRSIAPRPMPDGRGDSPRRADP